MTKSFAFFAVDTLQGSQDVELESARVEMFKGSMRLSVPETGSIQRLSTPLSLKANVSVFVATSNEAYSG